MLFTSLVVALAVTLGAAQNITNSSCGLELHNYAIELVGKSSQFKLRPPCPDSENVFVKFKFGHFEEFDSNGNALSPPRKITSFAGGVWGPPVQGTWTDSSGNDYNATSVTFTEVSKVRGIDVTFNFVLWLFDRVVQDSDLGTITTTGIKFDVFVRGWPLGAAGNDLTGVFSLDTKGGGRKLDQTSTSTNATHWTFDGVAQLNNPTTYQNTDASRNPEGNARTLVATTAVNGNSYDVSYTFKSVQPSNATAGTSQELTNVLLDPSLTVIFGSSPASTVHVSLFLLACSTVLALVMA